jgi:predicted ATPase
MIIPIEDTDRFFILTGGPGSGKTTLIAALGEAGYPHSSEAGRGVIRDQVAIGGRALPWCDPAAFAEFMLCWEMRSYHLARAQAGPFFFDRGVPDVAGYLRLLGLPVPAYVEKASRPIATTAASSSRRPGRTSSARTASAGKASLKPCEPTRRWSRPMANMATS